MDEKLQEAYTALQAAHDAGNTADATQLADYIETLKANQVQKAAADNEVSQVRTSGALPAIGGAVGATIGTAAAVGSKGKNILHALDKLSTNQNPVTGYNPRNSSVEESVQNWRTYADAQNEAAKSVRRDSELHKKYPGFTRPNLPHLQPVVPTTGQTVLGHAANFGTNRPITGLTAGTNAIDFAQQVRAGNPVQSTVSGLGLLGSAAPYIKRLPKPLRGAGMAVSAAAPVVNRLLDKLTNPPEEEQKAAGGAIQHFSTAGAVKTMAGGLQNAAKKFQKLPTSQVKVSEALEPHIGSYLGLTQSDNFGVHGNVPMGPPRAGETIHPSERMGGNKFSGFQRTNPAHQEANVAWMNDTEEHANDMVNRNTFNGKPVIWTTRLGTPNQLVSNKTVFNNVMDEFYKQKYTKDQYDKLNERIKFLKEKGKVRDNFDIRDRFAMQELGGDTFHGRRALGDMVGEGIGVGKTKGGLYLPNYEDILKSHRDPATQGLDTNALGQRLFTVDNTPSQFSTEFHPDYRYTVHGTDQGVEFPFSSPDKLTPRFYNNYVAKNNQAPAGNGWFGYMNDPQEISPELIKNLKKEGLAEGGSVPHLAGGGDPLKGANIVKHSISQIPKVAQALEEYLKGNITKAEHMEAVRKHLPIRQWNELPPEYTDEQIRNALRSNQLDKALAPVPVGKETGNRLDINAYTNNNPPVFVDTVHDINDNNKVLSYNRTGHLKDVNFKSLPNSAVMMGLGTREQALTPMGAQMGKSKAPIAMIEGTNVGTHDDEVRRMMAEMMKDPAYTQIGMDPRVGSQFYDKSTDRPIWTSGEKFQVGPLVMVPKKDIETTDWNDPRLLLKNFPGKTYKKGGLATLKKKK